MEGTDPIVDCDHAQDWWDLGLRAAGLAHYGHGQHASGTGVDGRLTQAGLALLRKFEELGMVLDVTHLCDTSLDEALENFDGIVVASHHNCRALVPGDRQLSDEHLRRLIARGAVIGLSLDAWMLRPGWVRGESSPEEVSLQDAVDHIDHICQIAGTVDHCGLGTDLDGGFGHEQTPHDLKRFRDLQNLQGLLSRRGYGGDDIEAVFSGNWRRLYRNALPKD